MFLKTHRIKKKIDHRFLTINEYFMIFYDLKTPRLCIATGRCQLADLINSMMYSGGIGSLLNFLICVVL